MWYFKAADMAMAPLTITYERQQYAHFTKPFMDLGLTILTAQETEKKNILGFLEPFEWDLWGAVVAAFIACGIAITICSYLR